MTRNRLNMLLAVLAMVVVGVAGFFIGVQPQLAQASSDHDQQTSVDATNATTAAELARLKERAKSLPQMRAELAELQASIPAGAHMSSFYSELDRVASSAGVKVSAITTSDAMAYTPPTSSASEATDTPSSAASSSADPSATPAPTASAAPSAPTVPTNPEITAANFSVVPVSVSVDGSFDQALAFVSGVQSGERLFLIDSISSTAAPDATGTTTDGTSAAGTGAASGASASATTWTFAGYVYVLSDTATTPTSTPAATPSDG